MPGTVSLVVIAGPVRAQRFELRGHGTQGGL
jgi:hypothetical protein